MTSQLLLRGISFILVLCLLANPVFAAAPDGFSSFHPTENKTSETNILEQQALALEGVAEETHPLSRSRIPFIAQAKKRLKDRPASTSRRRWMRNSLILGGLNLIGLGSAVALAQGTPTAPPDARRKKILDHVSQLHGRPVAERTRALGSLGSAAYWKDALSLSQADAQVAAAWAGTVFSAIQSGLEKLGIKSTGEPAFTLDSLERGLRMAHSLQKMQSAQTPAERAHEFVDVILRQGLLEEQRQLGHFLAAHIKSVQTAPGKFELDLSPDIDWAKWQNGSPPLLALEPLLAASRWFPGSADVLGPLAATMSEQLNLLVPNSVKEKNSQPWLDWLDDVLLDIGYATDLQYGRPGIRTVVMDGDFLELDFSKQEIWQADDVEAPVVPANILGTPSGSSTNMFAAGVKRTVLVRIDQNTGPDIQQIVSLRHAAHPESAKTPGRPVDLSAFKDIVEETFRGIPDDALVDPFQRRHYIHELLHVFRAARKYAYKPADAAGRPISLQQDFGFSNEEWSNISEGFKLETDLELDAYLGHVALSSDPYFEFAILAQNTAGDRMTDNTTRVADRIVKGLAARLSANAKLRPTEQKFVAALGALKRQVTFRESMALLTLLRTRGITGEEVGHAAAAWYEKGFGPLPKICRRPASPPRAALGPRHRRAILSSYMMFAAA
jgi:hypothetical protein